MNECEVAIIGAGPYGLSVAAHLKGLGREFRIFGSPMQTWLTQMPKGMKLKSEGFASSLFAPGGEFELEDYCKEKSLPYADTGLPVPLETFASYGLEFQKRLIPEVEERFVASLEQSSGGFCIRLDNGEEVNARLVVVAVGICHFQHVPSVFSGLGELVTHSSAHATVDGFRGQSVAIVGAGASAVDLAAVLHEAGACVELVARKPAVRFHDPPGPAKRSISDRIRRPMTGLGPGWRSYLCTNAPLVFRKMPEEFRLEVVKKHLGPAPGWFVKDQVVGKVGFNLGLEVTKTSIQQRRPVLHLTGAQGMKQLTADHVIAATGYKVDLGRLDFLPADLRAKIQTVDQAPALSSNFESSVRGLYFVGTSAANTFGPLMRFAYGAGFTARRLSRHLASRSARGAVPNRSTQGVQVLDRG